MISQFYTTFIIVDLALYEIFRAKICIPGKGSISLVRDRALFVRLYGEIIPEL